MTVETLSPTDKPQILDVVCDAFHDNGLMRYALDASGSQYTEHLRTVFDTTCETSFDGSLPIFGIRIDSRLRAVALLWPSKMPSGSAELRAYQARENSIIPDGAIQRLAEYDAMRKVGKPEAVHHYLDVLAVQSEYQGRGLGRTLVTHIQETVRVDEACTGLRLHTDGEANVAFYQHLGFRIDLRPDYGGLNVSCMWWDTADETEET